MYCVSPDRQGESEFRSEWIYLFLCDCLSVSACVVCLTGWQRVAHAVGETERQSMYICLDINLSILKSSVQSYLLL